MIDVALILLYGIMMGVTAQTMKVRSGEGGDWDWEDHPEIMFSIFWPILLPAMLGMALTSLVYNDRPSRIERKRQRELDDARHTVQLEKELGIR